MVQVETRARVSAVCDTRLCYTAVCPLVLKLKLGQYAPHGLTHECVTWLCGISQYTLQGTQASHTGV
ncbi:hypothetical protein F383_30118 [Gossypium arboreum]|uniref:Uncharacterized protein n=1 Tax=Gossypium arboreum TaxID=29729 RepID=A0A0B0MVZ9_GOSAR|nr:hypothetical protein F383_30118 [Gossypium arboreum]